jgi:TP901 family phage tail tape measure protein
MVDIAEVMIRIKGDASSLQNASNQAKSGLSDLTSGLKSVGAAGVAVGAALTAGITVPLTAVATLALKSASDVNGAFNTIIKQTGATGAALTALKADFSNIAGNVPNSMQDTATALSDVYDKSKLLADGIQLIGPQLDSLTTQFLNWSRISGDSVTSLIDDMSGIASRWNMTASQTSAAMDIINTISQKTGTDSLQLADDISKVSIAATALGLTFQGTATYVGIFEEAGLNATTIYTAMNKVVADAAKAGKDANTEWNEDINTLQQYITQGNNAGISTAAWTQLTTDFSSKTLTSLIAGLKVGTTSWQDLTNAIANSSGSINSTAATTITLSDAMAMLKTKVELAMAPLGTVLGGDLKNVVTQLTPLTGIISGVTAAFAALPAPVQNVIVLFGAILAAIGPTILSMGGFVSAVVQVGNAIAPAIVAIGAFIGIDSLGGLLTVLLPIAAAIGVVVAVLGTLTAGFIIAYQTSATLRGIISEVSVAFQDLGGHVMAAAADFMSGNWQGGFNEISAGLNGMLKTLKSIDWNSAGAEIIKEIQQGIANNKSGLLTAFNTFASDVLAFIRGQNWKDIGSTIGTLIGEGLATFLGAGSTGIGATIDKLMGNVSSTTGFGGGPNVTNLQANMLGGTSTTPVTGQDNTALVEAGKQAATAFWSGFSSGIQEGSSHVDWGGIAMGMLHSLDQALGSATGAAGSEGTGGLQGVINGFFSGLSNIGSLVGGLDSTLGIGSSIDDTFNGWGLGFLTTDWWLNLTLPDVGGIIGSWWNGIDWGGIFSGGGTSGATIDLSSKFAGLGGQITGFFSGLHLSLPAVTMPDVLGGLASIGGQITGFFSGLHLSLPAISMPNIDVINTLKSTLQPIIDFGTHVIGFTLSIPNFDLLNTLKGILEWIVSNFSVHDVGFNVSMGDLGALHEFHNTLRWIVDNFSIHEIGFDLKIFGIDTLNSAIKAWDSFSVHAKLGPWALGGQTIPDVGIGPETIPGFSAGPWGIPGFNAGPWGIPGFNAGPWGIPGFSAGPWGIPGVGWGGASIPGVGWGGTSFGWGGTSVGIPGFSIPGFDAGILGKWGGYSWGGTSLDVGGFSGSIPGFNAGPWGIPGFSAGPWSIPGVGWGGATIPGVGWGGFDVPGIGWGGFNVPGIGWGGFNVPGIGWGGATIPRIGTGAHTIPTVNVPGFGIDWSAPQIPTFAEGALTGGMIASRPTLAVFGEGRGREAFIPEELFWGVDDRVLNALPHHAGGAVYGGSGSYSSPGIDENTLVRALTKVLRGVRGGNVYHISGIKIDEVVDELKRKEAIDELMYGDY